MSEVRPGWYPDPQQAGWLRWFDGEQWSAHVQPMPAGALPTQPYAARRRAMSARAIVGLVLGAWFALAALGIVVTEVALPAFLDRQERALVSALTCADATQDAVDISKDEDEIPLVRIDDVALVEDRRDGFHLPEGSDEVLVLTCSGTATWQDGYTADATVELYLDKELTHIVAMDWED